MDFSEVIRDYAGVGVVYAGILYFFDNPMGHPISYCLGKGIVWPWSMNGGIGNSTGWLVFFGFIVVSFIWNNLPDETDEETR